jgi:hypothetical protein
LSFNSFRKLIYLRLPTEQYALLAVKHHRPSIRSPGYSLLQILRLSPPLQPDSGDGISKGKSATCTRRLKAQLWQAIAQASELSFPVVFHTQNCAVHSGNPTHTFSSVFRAVFFKQTAQFNLRVYGAF